MKEVWLEPKMIEIRAQWRESIFAKSLKGKLKLPLKGRLSDAEAHLESTDWEQRKSEFALYDSQQQLEYQKEELLLASQWADQAQKGRIDLCRELELRNRIHYESQVRNESRNRRITKNLR